MERVGGLCVAGNNIAWIKFKRRFWRWVRIVGRETIAPLVDRTAMLQVLGYPFFLWFLFLAAGFQAMSEEALISETAFWAMVYAIPFFIVINCFRALFITVKEEREEGQWFGRSFVYHQPRLLATDRVNDSDNGKTKKLTTAPAEPTGSVELRVDVDGFEQRRIRIQVSPEERLLEAALHPEMPSGIGIHLTWANGGKLYYRTECTTSNPSIVRFYLLSWTA